MSRYIDADDVIELVWRVRLDTRERIAELINNAPTADVVPVVRCASCRFYDPEWKFCNHHRTGRAPDYYCASGRTKE